MNQMIQGSVKLIKKDSKGKSLRDIEFVITSSDGAEVAKAKTDSAGEVILMDCSLILLYDHRDKDSGWKESVKRTNHRYTANDDVTGRGG